MKKAFLALVLLWATLGLKAQLPAAADADTKYATELLKPGTEAPDFRLKTLDGKTLQLSRYKGRLVVLDFWASWCPDCRKDAPDMVRLYNQFHPKGVEFIGVSFDTDKAAWQQATDKYGIAYPQVSELKRMREADISKAYGIKWIPTTYLLDREGKVVLGTVLVDKLEKTLYEQTAQPFDRNEERLQIDGAVGRLSAIVQKPRLEQGQRCPLVVICHGFMGRKEGQLNELIADSLQANGIASVRFDFNGHGESEGDFEKMTVPNEIEDLKHVLEYVRDLSYVSQVGVVGHSQGGVVASMAAGQLEPGDLGAVVLLAPAAVLRDDAIRGNTFGSAYDPLDPPAYVELFGGKHLGRDYIKSAFSLPIYETAQKYQGPALIVHGTGDRIVPYTYGERYHQVWPQSQFTLLEGMDHGFTQNVYRVADLAVKFFKEKLK